MKPITKNEMNEWIEQTCLNCRVYPCPEKDMKTFGKFIKTVQQCHEVRRAIEKLIEKQGGKK